MKRGNARTLSREGGSKATQCSEATWQHAEAEEPCQRNSSAYPNWRSRTHTLQFTSLAHLLNVEMLGEAYRRLRKDASPGVDGLTAQEYEQDLEGNLQDLHRRLREGRYRAQPVRRVYIEQEGKRRPLGIPALEDKIVQKAASSRFWRRSTSKTSCRAPMGIGPVVVLRTP